MRDNLTKEYHHKIMNKLRNTQLITMDIYFIIKKRYVNWELRVDSGE